jgi:hypothetical protein
LNSLQRESVSTGKRKQEREDRTVGWGENPIGFGSFFYTGCYHGVESTTIS